MSVKDREVNNMTENNREHYPTLEEVNAVRELHDRLICCSYSTHSGGMMFNSDSSLYISVEIKNGEQLITRTDKEAFKDSVTAVYKAKTDVLSEIKALTDRENMAAWHQLKYYQEFFATDVSYGEGCWLVFEDDSEKLRTMRNIDFQAVRQQGAGAAADEFRRILVSAAEQGELVSGGAEDLTPDTDGFTVPPADTKPREGTPCPSCGAEGNTGRFCRECGHKLF